MKAFKCYLFDQLSLYCNLEAAEKICNLAEKEPIFFLSIYKVWLFIYIFHVNVWFLSSLFCDDFLSVLDSHHTLLTSETKENMVGNSVLSTFRNILSNLPF